MKKSFVKVLACLVAVGSFLGSWLAYCVSITNWTDCLMTSNIENQVLAEFDAMIANMPGLFDTEDTSHLFAESGVELGGFDTNKVADISYMFYDSELDLSGFDTSKVEDMSYRFCGIDGSTDQNNID